MLKKNNRQEKNPVQKISLHKTTGINQNVSQPINNQFNNNNISEQSKNDEKESRLFKIIQNHKNKKLLKPSIDIHSDYLKSSQYQSQLLIEDFSKNIEASIVQQAKKYNVKFGQVDSEDWLKNSNLQKSINLEEQKVSKNNNEMENKMGFKSNYDNSINKYKSNRVQRSQIKTDICNNNKNNNNINSNRNEMLQAGKDLQIYTLSKGNFDSKNLEGDLECFYPGINQSTELHNRENEEK